MIKDKYNSHDTIINLSDLFPEEWDTVYFFGACSAEEIAKRTGNRSHQDMGNRTWNGIACVHERC